MSRFCHYLKDALTRLDIAFTEEQLSLAEEYKVILLRENEKMNLTAITDDEDIAVKHFADSLCLLKYGEVAENAALIDIGSGAGFPGLVLKIFRPDLRITLMDSLEKRCKFLKSAAGDLGLEEISVLCCRAEEAGREENHRERYDYATARAVAALPVLLEYALPLLKVGGAFLPLKGKAEEDSADGALAALHGEITVEHHYDLLGQGERTIYIIKKTAPTEEKYPRGVGKPAKSPL